MTTHALIVHLRSGSALSVPMQDHEHAQQSLAFAAMTWLRLPPEARPASCWLIGRTGTAPEVTEAGVGEREVSDLLAVVDPREVAAVQVVAVGRKRKGGGE